MSRESVPPSASTAPLRAAGALGVIWGAAVLAVGPALWSAVGGGPLTEADRIAMKVLGIRHLGQGTFQLLAPTRWQPLVLAVDLLHTATMAPLAATDPARRGPAAVSGSISLVSAVALLASRRTQPPPLVQAV